MKKLLLALLICSLSVTAHAQAQDDTVADKQRHRAGLQVGVAVPTAKFSDVSFEDGYPSFAQAGLLLNANYSYSLSKWIAAGASVNYRYNKYDLDKLIRPDDELVTDNTSKAWRSVFALADVYVRAPLSKAIEAYAKGSAGTSFNRSASWEVETRYGDIYMPSDKATAFAYGWAAGFNFFSSNTSKLIINLEAGSVYTRPEFKVLDVKGNYFNIKQPLHTATFSLGATLPF
ncbi:hypothetical protein [Pontibacter rugosus]|uniref:Outer membrane protein beta-barrel domain-containing protein n=1 Tax=Pontibacter rugosus TaxID=1745966 RepID=A0ABW3SLM6_9BACT